MVPAELQVGDHLRSPRSGYDHHGIYVGNGWVAHFTGVKGLRPNAKVQLGTLEQFAAGSGIEVVLYDPRQCDELEVVLSRVDAVLHTSGYRLLEHNCEHVAVWCKTGVHRSLQAESVKKVAWIGVGVVAVGWMLKALSEPKTPTRRSLAVPRCKGSTQAGKQCSFAALEGNYGYCGVHRR